MEIKQIKSQLTIQQVLNHYHYKPTPKGSMRCPFHEPKKGSKQKKTLQVYTDTNRYQCFHADCKAVNGDVIDFIELQENCNKHQAIEIAKGLLNTPISKDIQDASRHVGTGNSKDTQDAFRSTEQAIHDAHSDVSSRSSEASTGTSSESHRPGEKSKVPEGGVFVIQSSEHMHYLGVCRT